MKMIILTFFKINKYIGINIMFYKYFDTIQLNIQIKRYEHMHT